MSLLTRLGKRFREKPKSTNLKLPTLPTPREILDDIDSCQSNDSIIALATLIQKKGRSSLLDIELPEDPTLISDTHLSFLSPYQINEKISEDITFQGKTSVKGKGSGGPNLAVSGNFKSKKPSDLDQINNYNKLKQFLLLYEKSEEMMDNLEPLFKRVETTLKECRIDHDQPTKLLTAEELNDGGNDVCSSPLL